ncbi:MAG: DUF1631 family protein [Gammaproteobacteria bacterium]
MLENIAGAAQPPPEDSVVVANQMLKQAIQEAGGPLPPEFILRFLLNEWRQYLYRIHRRYGSGDEWRIATQTTELFLWGTSPKRNAEERRSMAAQVPDMVSLVHEVMDIAGTDDMARNDFLNALSEWHLRIISRAPELEIEMPKPKDPDDATVPVRMDDVRFRELMDVLDGTSIEHVEM